MLGNFALLRPNVFQVKKCKIIICCDLIQLTELKTQIQIQKYFFYFLCMIYFSNMYKFSDKTKYAVQSYTIHNFLIFSGKVILYYHIKWSNVVQHTSFSNLVFMYCIYFFIFFFILPYRIS